MPSDGLARIIARGDVRHSSTIRSECSARLIQIFEPLTTYLSPTFFANGRMPRGVGAAGRLGDAERLQPHLAGGDLRQPRLLLRWRASAAAACPWCTSGRGTPRHCSPSGGSPPAPRTPPKAPAPSRHSPPESAPTAIPPRVSAFTNSVGYRPARSSARQYAPGKPPAQPGHRIPDFLMILRHSAVLLRPLCGRRGRARHHSPR